MNKLQNKVANSSLGDPPPHYVIPGTDLELIDIIKAKMSKCEWQKFCWASAIQYVYRVLDKGEPAKDAGKAITYMSWLKKSLEEPR